MLRFVLRIRIGRVVLLLFRRRVRMLLNQRRLILFPRFPRFRFRDRFRCFSTPGRFDQECIRPLELRSSPVFAAKHRNEPLEKLLQIYRKTSHKGTLRNRVRVARVVSFIRFDGNFPFIAEFNP